jgi:cobyrinic acid a,c-diamide synthase
LLDGLRIGIARDDAFTFIYAANVKLLEDMGATCVYFSPLHDELLPEVDALWLPGGYPELHHKKLSANKKMLEQIKGFHQSGKKILAECGGMLYLMESLTDVEGKRENMAEVLSGHGIMRERGGCQGMQYAPLPQGEIRAHAHHRTRCENTMEPVAFGRRLRHPAPGEAIYQTENLTASYLHFYFPSNPQAIAKLLS